MKTLVINSGSSSLKFQLYEMPEEEVLIYGYFERIGMSGSFYTLKLGNDKKQTDIGLSDHKEAFNILIKELFDNKIISSLDEIKSIGHRVVQGGSYFSTSVVINDDVIDKISELSSLAPLHNPAALVGIKASMEVIPNAINVAVFDTAFHQTMPSYNYLYALPYSWYEDFGIRRYGAHGTSHKYISLKMNEILGRSDTKIISCHIGNGASVCAIENGKSINTSMGLTPNAGLVMGTRCGDIDASIIPYIMDRKDLNIAEIDKAINKESGLLGISGISSDSRDIEDGIVLGNERCILAQKISVRRIVDYIAKYYVEMGGCDAIVFTAGLGEKSIMTRVDVLNELKVLGIVVDDELNNTRGVETIITTKESKIPCYVVLADEELMIARDTFELIK